ncbi:MAG: hypothetical protein OFPI_00950 [Osedax symbiont Rs2]|nr:MAG: hypothetical protein OFPI_00950 [Osedax symbiont Rs2]
MTLDISYIAPVITPNAPCSLGKTLDEIQPGLEAIQAVYSSVTKGRFEGITAKEDARYMNGVARVIYQYSIEGILPTRLTQEIMDVADQLNSTDLGAIFLDFSTFCLASRVGAELTGYGNVTASCEQIMAMAIVRNKLDYQLDEPYMEVSELEPCDEPFTLKEIAILAQMNERSVRNATLSSARDRLATSRDGKRVTVNAPEVASWLNRRKNFKPTRAIE